MGNHFKARFVLCAILAASSSCTQPVSDSKPQPPGSLLAAAVSSSSIILNWSDQSGGKATFSVERSTSTTAAFVRVSSVPAGTISFTDTGLTPSTTYYYRVAAVLGSLLSDYSTVANATTSSGSGLPDATTVPDYPSNLTASGTGPTAITLNWTDNADDEAGFNVMRVTSLVVDQNPLILTLGNPVPANSTSFTDSGGTLLPATDYGYVVVAFNTAGTSDLSNLAWATTLSASTLPAPSGLLASKGVFKTNIYLDWTPVPNATSYKTYEAWALDSSFTLLGTANTAHAWITGSTSNVHDYFRVSAIDSGGDETGRSGTVEGWAGTLWFDEGFEAGRLQGYWEQISTTSQFAYDIITPGRTGSGSCLELSGGTTSQPGLSASINASATPSRIGFWIKSSYTSASLDTARFGVYDNTYSSLKRSVFIALTAERQNHRY